MRLYIVGVSCVGKSSLGKALAEKYNHAFYDFDYVVMHYYNDSMDNIKDACGFINPDREYRLKVRPLLKQLLEENRENVVIAMPPGGLCTEYYKLLKQHQDVIKIELIDDAEAILKRSIFLDEENRLIENVITPNNRPLYLKSIKADIRYYKNINKKADLKVNLGQRNMKEALKYLDNKLKAYIQALNLQ